MENVNMWVKQLPIGDCEESWIKNSPNVTVVHCSIVFENYQDKKGFTDFNEYMKDGSYQSKYKRSQDSIQPKYVVEKTRIFGFIMSFVGN